MDSQLLTVLGTLANPVRLRVISYLRDNDKVSYTDLIKACDLSSYSESGKLGYNLHKLLSLGLIAKDESEYVLTGNGRRASKLLETIKKEVMNFFHKKQNQKEK